MSRNLMNVLLVVAGLALGLVVVEMPAFWGWVDYRFLAGGMEARRIRPQPRPHPPRKHLSGEEHGDLVEPLGLPEIGRYAYHFRADRRGFRNSTDIERADIVVIGDSFVENARLADHEILTTQLAGKLAVDVISFGRSGFGPIEELDTLREHVVRMHPKVVVWVFFEGNDLADIHATTQPKRPPFARRSFLRNVWLALESNFEDNAGTSIERDHGDSKARSRRCVPNCTEPECEPLYFGFRINTLNRDDEDSLTTALDIFGEAKRLTESGGATLILAFAPVKFRVYGDICRDSLSTELRGWRLNDLPDRLRRWSAGNGVAYVDLTAPLQDAARRRERVYFADDTHWNARANAIAADSLAEIVRATLKSEPQSDKNPCRE